MLSHHHRIHLIGRRHVKLPDGIAPSASWRIRFLKMLFSKEIPTFYYLF